MDGDHYYSKSTAQRAVLKNCCYSKVVYCVKERGTHLELAAGGRVLLLTGVQESHLHHLLTRLNCRLKLPEIFSLSLPLSTHTFRKGSPKMLKEYIHL